MCGITGYAGTKEVEKFLMEGLKKLEYRGYDSAGIATLENSKIRITKAKGKLEELQKKISNLPHRGSIGIGHTRWATHGKPDEINSHPHISQDGNFAVVHNGIIENYLSLRKMLEENGFEFHSETDTEVIPHLVQLFYTHDVFEAFAKAVSMIKGTYALGLISTYDPNRIFATAKDSPLIIGIGENENFIASDIPALLSKTDKAYLMHENEFAVISKDEIVLTDNNKNPIIKEITQVHQDEISASKNGYEFFMLKEIMEQPEAVKNTIMPIIEKGYVDFKEIKLPDEYLTNLNKVFIVGCGSAYHAGLVGKHIIENMTKVHTVVEIASEFRYTNHVIEEGDLVIAISQSGETSDTLAALKYAKLKGAETISIVNVKESSIARDSENVVYTNAGPEIAVATTKAYLTQIMVVYMLSVYIARRRKTMSDAEEKEIIKQMSEFSESIENVLKDHKKIKEIAREFMNEKSVFFIGRGADNYFAMEGALKLKEISYIHAESYAAGELKHGTISLIEEGTLVVALCTQKELYQKMLGNIKEVKARGATVIVIASNGIDELELIADKVFEIPDINGCFSGLLAIILLQLFAYYVSYYKGLDVDKPRNLAKSVTVE